MRRETRRRGEKVQRVKMRLKREEEEQGRGEVG